MESKSKSVAETLAEDAILAEQGIISESDFREFLLKDEGRKLKIKYYLQGFRACVEQAAILAIQPSQAALRSLSRLLWLRSLGNYWRLNHEQLSRIKM